MKEEKREGGKEGRKEERKEEKREGKIKEEKKEGGKEGKKKEKRKEERKEDQQFLVFFFKHLKVNKSGRYQEHFPFLSLCGRERNFLRCDDQPVVFTHLLSETGYLSYCGGGTKLTVPFYPPSLLMHPDSGRVYHPAPQLLGGVGLVRSALAMEFSPHFQYSEDSSMTEKFKLDPHHIFGLRHEAKNNLHFVDDQTVIFPSGNQIVRHNLYQQWSKFIPVAEGSKGIQAMALSPDRHYLAVSELREQGTITIYELQDYQCHKRQVLTGGDISAQGFVCMAFSADSKYLLGQSGGLEWILFYWEWEKSEVVSTQHTTRLGIVRQVSFNPKDSNQICVCGKDVFKTYKLQKETLKRTSLFKIDINDVLCLTWMSSDCIVAGTESGKLLLMMVKSGQVHELGRPCERQTENVGTDSVVSSQAGMQRITAITQYSRGFACSAGPALICLYEKTKEQHIYRKTKQISIPPEPCLQQSRAERQEISYISMNPSEETLAITTDQGQVYHIELDFAETEQAKFEFLFHSLHTGSITGMSVCESKPLIATCSTDNSVRIWNFMAKSLELYRDFPKEPHCVTLHPNGFFILVGFFDKLCLMSLLVDKFRTTQEFPISPCDKCVFNHDGNFFAAVSTKVIYVCNARTRQKMDLKGHHRKVLSVNWSKDDRRLVSCGMDGSIYVWNILTGTCELDIVQSQCITTVVTFSPSTGNVLAVGSDFKLKEFQAEEMIKELPSDGVAYTAICVTHSGKAVFVGTSVGTVRVMKYPLQQEDSWAEYQAHSGPITNIVTTPGDCYLLTASDDGSLLIWTVTDNMGRKLSIKEMKYTDEVLCSTLYLEEKEKIFQEANNLVMRLEFEQQNTQHRKDMVYQQKIYDIERNFLQQIKNLKQQNEVMILENEKQKILLAEMIKKHIKELEDEKQDHHERINKEYEKHVQLEQTLIKVLKEDWEKKLCQQEKEHVCAIKELKKAHEAKLLEQQVNFHETRKKIKESVLNTLDVGQMNKEFKDKLDLLAEQESQLKSLKRELEDRDLRINKLKKDLKSMQDAVNKVKELTKEKEAQHKRKQLASLHERFKRFNKGQDDDYVTLQSRMNQLRQERDHLKKLGQPKEIKLMQQKIEENKSVIKELKTELTRSKTNNREIIEDLKKRLKIKDEELHRVRHTNTLVEKMKADIQMGSNFLHDAKRLRDYFMKLQKCYILNPENVRKVSIIPAGDTRRVSTTIYRNGQATANLGTC
ncbi:Cilia- and flagella-associated protein 57 [Bagarius yarrelli]|uniref:Cilia-and flagella-associated protein 57 n=1 Tax=Bagarius yarrelli TaxID=175774 RepID=A0A556TZG4_BAGYA|nr:Cilia- and flagella-associated protein 57 [Bagarius yarrelli]